MTSIPASRKARAITLAPRSWPSRPGFATSTRIFKSAIDLHLTTEGAKAHSYRGLRTLDCRLDCRLWILQISDFRSQFPDLVLQWVDNLRSKILNLNCQLHGLDI